MATLPASVQNYPLARDDRPLIDYLNERGWLLTGRGKVRDSYAHRQYPQHFLPVATDRLSIFDFVLPCLVPGKGAVLTALTHFWLTDVLKDVSNHLDRLIADLGEDFPFERALMVRRAEIQPFEMIFRAHIGGSVWKEYQAKGTAAGQKLPVGLARWQRLEAPVFTPSTKEESGHDQNVTAAQYLEEMGELGARTVSALTAAYQKAYAYAKERGILILDTKFEAGKPFILADEVLTPDSSRFVTVTDWEVAVREGRDPAFYDKELVRQWGRTVETPFGVTGINNLDPENPEHLAFVHNTVTVPDRIIQETANRYHAIFLMLVGMPLRGYQETRMEFAA